MSFTLVLRIFTVVMLGWVVAHSARLLLTALVRQERLPARAVVGEVLTGVGAFVIGWGLLPGGTDTSESIMMLVGSLVLAVGIIVQPTHRATSGA